MMNNRSIGTLIVVILIMGIAIYVHQRSDVSPTDDMLGALVFPKMKADLDHVQQVTFASASKTTTIEHTDNHWTIDEKGGYEADFAKLSKFLNGMAKATYMERKTSRRDNYSVLGVEGIDDNSSKSTQVTVSTTDGSQYQLLIGKNSESENGRFVRKPSDDQAWLVDNLEDASGDPLKWIDPVVFSIDEDQVMAVTDTPANGKGVVTVKRDKDQGNFTVENLPKGAKLKYASIADSLSRALVNIRTIDVRPRGETEWKHAATAAYTLKDGSSILVHAMKDDNGRFWLRFDLTKSKKPSESVSFVDPARLAGFDFEVPDYTYNEFTHTMDAMIKKEGSKSSAKPGTGKATG